MRKTMTIAVVLIAGALAGTTGAGAAVAAPAASSPSPSSSPQAGGSASADAAQQTRGGTAAVGGGIWTYGVGNGVVTSVYDNHRFDHSASVKSSGKTKSSGRVVKGRLAVANRPSAFSGNQAFWNIY